LPAADLSIRPVPGNSDVEGPRIRRGFRLDPTRLAEVARSAWVVLTFRDSPDVRGETGWVDPRLGGANPTNG